MNIPEGWPTEAMIDSGVKALNNGWYINADETCAEIFKEMFATAPTPTAPEDEPVAVISKTGEALEQIAFRLFAAECRNLPIGLTKVYTRPSSELRKAAEDVLLIANEDDLSMKMIKAIDSLSAALDK